MRQEINFEILLVLLFRRTSGFRWLMKFVNLFYSHDFIAFAFLAFKLSLLSVVGHVLFFFSISSYISC
jgi:hypothetical protein